jgi:glycogen operon protein
MLSQGVPMLLAGDEMLRTQRGNNNAWCQDNETSWLDWSLAGRHADFLRFTRELVRLRRRHRSLRRSRFLTGRPRSGADALPDIRWSAADGAAPDWRGPGRFLAFTLAAREAGEPHLHVMLNMSAQPCEAMLPDIEGLAWRRAIDTSLAAPDDIAPPEQQVEVGKDRYEIAASTVVVLEAWEV